ncbi:response regulator transcription factor [Leucobacter sp.]
MSRSVNRFIAIAGDGEYVLADSSGRVIQQGRLPARISASIVVIADYSLLERPELAEYADSDRIGLLRPDRRQSAISAARQWARTPQGDRAYLCLATEFPELRPLFSARAEIVSDQRLMLDRVRERLVAVSPEYAAILSDRDELITQALPILRDHPTPKHLQSAAIVQLSHVLHEHLPEGRQTVIDRLFALRDGGGRGVVRPAAIAVETAEAMIPGDIDTYLQLEAHLTEVDQRIYRQISRDAVGATATTDPRRFSLLQLSGSPARRTEPSDDPEKLIAEIAELLAKRYTPERHALSDYETFLCVRTALDAPGARLEPEVALRLETLGQLLALSTGRFHDAIRYRTACDAQLARLTPPSDQPSGLVRLLTDATLAMAITEMCAIDFVTGFTALRAAVESRGAQRATPEILGEALGLFALAIIFFGEHSHYPQALELMRGTIAQLGGAGPARAMADISEYFLIGGRLDARPDALDQARARAEEHSRETHYRAYFHYVTMLTCYVTDQPENGITAYSEIAHEGLWSRYNRRMNRLARLNYSIMLAGLGKIGLARRELAAIQQSSDRTTEGADGVIREFTELRLDLSTGEHKHVLARTRTDGPLGEEQIVGVHLRRYVPTSLLFHGTALWREGARERAIECFVRATALAASGYEWYALLAGQTPEYHEWVDALDASRLPAGLTPEIHAALRSRPPFISLSLPALTPRQRRIMPLLAQGRSISSIATELHVSMNTLKTHLRALYQKLGVKSRDQAVIQAEAYGLFDLPSEGYGEVRE